MCTELSRGGGRCFQQMPAPERHLPRAYLSSSITVSAGKAQGTVHHLFSTRRRTVSFQRHVCRANLAVAESGGSGRPAVLKLLSDQFLPIALVAGMTTGYVTAAMHIPAPPMRCTPVLVDLSTDSGICNDSQTSSLRLRCPILAGLSALVAACVQLRQDYRTSPRQESSSSRAWACDAVRH